MYYWGNLCYEKYDSKLLDEFSVVVKKAQLWKQRCMYSLSQHFCKKDKCVTHCKKSVAEGDHNRHKLRRIAPEEPLGVKMARQKIGQGQVAVGIEGVV
jgi:hypothetical protein